MPDSRVTDVSPEHARLAEIIDVVVAIASNDFDKRASVGDGNHVLDGLATGLNMLAEEIGQRYARERLYQQRLLQHERLIAVGQLAAGVAHEINNPAAFVLTNLSVLDRILDEIERVPLPPAASQLRSELVALTTQARDVTRDNVAGVERIVSIVRELRNFSRLESDRLETVLLEAVIADACRLVRAELTYRAHLHVETSPDLEIRGDRTKLAQVFTNLLMNAAHAIPEGAPDANEVRIRALARDDRAIVHVIDTGSGMAADVQERLFEPFFTTKPRERGTGLGLAISADIVRLHGGELRLLDTSPLGSTFEVVLPLDGSHVQGAAPERAIEFSEAVRRARVMIVDDEVMLLDAYRRFFRDVYDLTLLASGRDAIAAMESQHHWDAIVCDVMMPDLDGQAVHRWVSDHRPELLDRLLFCTGGAFTPRSVSFTERMAERVLQKPVRMNDLRSAIDGVRELATVAPGN
jgi:signal transduction histidine kinase